MKWTDDNGVAMKWTDDNGVTHEVEPIVWEGNLRPGTCSRRWNIKTGCGCFGPIGAPTSAKDVDCMTCLVKETT